MYKLKTAKGHKFRINRQLYRIRMYAEGLTADWNGTFWKNKKQVREALRISKGELNRLYDELDKFTGIKNERKMI